MEHTETFNTVADQNWRAYVRARDNGHSAYVTLAKKCDDYYLGDQWDEAVKAELEGSGRPALTINEVLPTVNTLIGEQTLKRADFLFKPKRNGNAETAAALTKVCNHIADDNKLDRIETRLFADGIIQERGFFDVRIDFDDSLTGEVKITVDDPLEVLLDPDAKEYDPRTWKEVTTSRWMSIDDIRQQYGEDKANDVKHLLYGGENWGVDSVEIKEQTFAGEGQTMFTDGELVHDAEFQKTIRRIRVIERQWRRLGAQKWFVDPQTGDMRRVPETWEKERVAEFAKKWQLEITKKLTSKIRWTVNADRVTLHDDWSPYKTFTKIPYFPFFRRGRPMGVVRNLLSPQDQLNKVSSQELHVVNTSANSGWTVEQGTLTNMETADLESVGAKTGLVIEYARGATPPEKLTPNQIPTGLDRISTKSQMHIRNISGVNESLRGEDGSEVSGIAIKEKQSRGLVQMEVPFDNLAYTRELLAEKLLELVQQFYTEERILHITNYNEPSQPTEEYVVNQTTPEGQVVNDLTLGEYAVVVSQSPARDTYEESQFAEAIGLREIGVAIPDHAIIGYSNLAHKKELALEVRELAGQGAPSEEELQMMEIQKQIELKRAMGELAELEAKANELNARAQKQMAEAMTEMLEAQAGGMAPAEAQVKMQTVLADMEAARMKIAGELQRAREEIEGRIQVALIGAQQKDRADKVKLMESKLKSEEAKGKTAAAK